MSKLSEAIKFAEQFPLPRCEHGNALRDYADENLEPPCGCRFEGGRPLKQEVVEMLKLRRELDPDAPDTIVLPVKQVEEAPEMAQTDDLYGVGGELYAFVHHMRNGLRMLDRPAMARRAQELLDKIVARDQEVEAIANRITEECKAELDTEDTVESLRAELAEWKRKYNDASIEWDDANRCGNEALDELRALRANQATVVQDVWLRAMEIANICVQEHLHEPDELGERQNPAACVYLALEAARHTETVSKER